VACVVRITGIDNGTQTISFSGAGGAPYNAVGNPQCTEVETLTPDGQTMMYRFIGRSFRIDPARKDLSVFQTSPSGELQGNDWIDLGIGFTDFQIASHYFEDGDLVDTADADAPLNSPERDWYSGEAQENPDPTAVRPANSVLTQLTFSFAIRTHMEVSGIFSSATPAFIDESNMPDSAKHNAFGDRPAIQLAGVADAARPLEHRGDHLYRWVSMTIDTRNIGVGL
jgi:hypothetical protein